MLLSKLLAFTIGLVSSGTDGIGIPLQINIVIGFIGDLNDNTQTSSSEKQNKSYEDQKLTHPNSSPNRKSSASPLHRNSEQRSSLDLKGMKVDSRLISDDGLC